MGIPVMGRLNRKALLSGAWTLGKFAYGHFKHAEREHEAREQQAAFEARKAALLAANNPLTGFAGQDELARYLYRMQDGLYFGRIASIHGLDFEAGMSGDRHAFTFANTGAGKGRTLLLQNCIRWPGPLLVIDPKGEAASYTAMRRGTAQNAHGTGTSVRNFLGQKVAILDPLNVVRGPARMRYKVRYNPLADIDMRRPDFARRIRAIASGLVIAEQGRDAHFSENATSILRGIIEAVKLCEPPRQQTLSFVRAVLAWGYMDILGYLEHAPETRSGFIRDAVGLLLKTGEDECGAYMSTLSRNLAFLSEPAMQDHMAASDFSLWRAVQEGWTVYICIPPDEIHDYRNWMRVLVRIALRAKIALGTGQTGLQSLFCLDEFPLMGRFEEIEQSSGFMRDYGVKLWPIAQSITQLKNLYATNWETFLENAGAVLAFGLNSSATEDYISKRLGRVRVWQENYGASIGANTQDAFSGVGGGNMGVNQGLQQMERLVRLPNEVHGETAPATGRAFVIPSEGKPFIIQRQNYDQTIPPGLFDGRDFVKEWERRYGESI